MSGAARALCVAGVMAGAVAFAGSAAQPQSPTVQRWEYATLERSGGQWIWHDPQKKLWDSLPAVGRAIGGDAAEPVVSDVVNLAGARGWELVSANGSSFWFKRPATAR